MPKYRVTVKEVQHVFYEIEAEDARSAMSEIYRHGESKYTPTHSEYSHDLPVEQWDIEELKEKK